jgi:hypothetical protein
MLHDEEPVLGSGLAPGGVELRHGCLLSVSVRVDLADRAQRQA